MDLVDFSYLGTAGVFVQLALLFFVMGLLTRNELGLRLLLLIGSMFYITYYYHVTDVHRYGTQFGPVLSLQRATYS